MNVPPPPLPVDFTEPDRDKLFKTACIDLENHKRLSEEETARHRAREREKWGPYLADCPFEIANPSRLEALAWHAPGLLGRLVRDAAPYMDRASLVPALLAGLTTLCRLQQGKVVSVWSGHITPTAVMLWGVGPSGSGKGEACGLIDKWLSCVDPINLHGIEMRDFKSGAGALSNFAAHGSITLTQEEAGALMTAQKGDGHGATALVAMTEIFTAFSRGIKGLGAANLKDNTEAVDNPCLSAFFGTTPGKLDQAMSAADAESGWLGRWLAIYIPDPAKRFRTGAYSPSEPIRAELQALANRTVVIGEGKTWLGKNRPFQLVQYSQEASDALWANSEAMEAARKTTASEVRKNIAARANEATNRVATTVGAPSGHIDLEAVQWSMAFVDESLNTLTNLMAGKDEAGEGASPGAKARAAVVRMFERAKSDPAFMRKYGGRLTEDGFVELPYRAVQQFAKDSIDSKTATTEIEAMIEDGRLFQFREENAHHRSKGTLKLLR